MKITRGEYRNLLEAIENLKSNVHYLRKKDALKELEGEVKKEGFTLFDTKRPDQTEICQLVYLDNKTLQRVMKFSRKNINFYYDTPKEETLVAWKEFIEKPKEKK